MIKADRFNKGKPKLSYIPPLASREIAKVFMFGAEKYAAFNWMKGLSYLEAVDSIERHINDFKACKDLDDESGLSVVAHAACGILMLLESIQLKIGTDDRPKEYYKINK